MKHHFPKSIVGIYFITLSFLAYSQGGVSINNTNTPAHPSAMLDISSTSAPYMGMLIPRMTTANRNTIVAPATGLQIFNIDCGINEYYTGSCWVSMNQILKTPQPLTCSGTTDFCANETRTFSIPAVTGATSHFWYVPAGASITSGQGTTTVTVQFGNNSGQVCVRGENICETGANSCIDIHINPVPPAPGNITGPTTVVPGTSANYFIAAVTGAGVYNWTVPAGATITSGVGTTTIAVSFPCSTVSGNISVTAQSNCGISASTSLAITMSSLTANAGGPSVLTPGILGGSPTASAGAGSYTYVWLPSTALSSTTVSNPTSTACSPITYTVTVTDANGCIARSSTTTSPGNPVLASGGPAISLSPGTIGGSPTASAGTPPYAYAWVPSTTLSSTTIANPTTTACSPTTYTVTVTDANGCTSSSSTTASMFNPVLANAGPTMTPPGTLGGLPTASGGTSPYNYAWIPSTNLSSTTNANPTTTVCITTTYSVTVTDANGCSATSSAIASVTNPIPATPGPIAGNTNPACGSAGNVYSISPVPAATTYTWTVPSGSNITAGQGTTSIMVTLGSNSGNITVTAGNNCGTSSPGSLAITVGAGNATGSQTFNYTGSMATFTVPNCVSSLTVTAIGAGGGGNYLGKTGGTGGKIVGVVTVTPNQIFDVVVGGQGLNGGNTGNRNGNGGGGFSGLLTGTTHIISAGGGGGRGGPSDEGSEGGQGGNGGTSGTTGGNGNTCTNGGAGGSANASPSGGAAGTSCGDAAVAGSSTGGGAGGNSTGDNAGAGGGGGYGTAPGAGASTPPSPQPGQPGGFGGGGGGGGGGSGSNACRVSPGGGGGGGFNGGGGGATMFDCRGGGGGGGGANYAQPGITVITNNSSGSAAETNGSVTITW